MFKNIFPGNAKKDAFWDTIVTGPPGVTFLKDAAVVVVRTVN